MKALLPLAAVLACAAGPAPADPNWPCVQRLVPSVTMGTYWAGPPAASDWRSDPRVVALVAQVAPRSVSREAGAKQLEAFAATVPAPERPIMLAKVFAGLVDETNTQRTQVIDRLRDIAIRQRNLTGVVGKATSELRALPSDAPAAEREEVTNRRGFLIRDYEAVEQTIRYACEAPVQLEARLGAFARTLQGAIGG